MEVPVSQDALDGELSDLEILRDGTGAGHIGTQASPSVGSGVNTTGAANGGQFTQEAEHLARRKSIWNSVQNERRDAREAETGIPVSVGGEQVSQVESPVAKHGHAQTKGFAASTATVPHIPMPP